MDEIIDKYLVSDEISAEKKIDDIANALLNQLKKYPKDTPINVEDFQENFMNIDQDNFTPELINNHFYLLIAILQILPKIYKNRMKKLYQLIRGLEESFITGEYIKRSYRSYHSASKIRLFKSDIYFDLIDKYLNKILKRYTRRYDRQSVPTASEPDGRTHHRNNHIERPYTLYFSGLNKDEIKHHLKQKNYDLLKPRVISNTHVNFLITTILYKRLADNSIIDNPHIIETPTNSEILDIGVKRSLSPNLTVQSTNKYKRYNTPTLPSMYDKPSTTVRRTYKNKQHQKARHEATTVRSHTSRK